MRNKMYENLEDKYPSWEGWVLFSRFSLKFLATFSVSVFEIKFPLPWLLFGVLKANFCHFWGLLCISSSVVASYLLWKFSNTHSFRLLPAFLFSIPLVLPFPPENWESGLFVWSNGRCSFPSSLISRVFLFKPQHRHQHQPLSLLSLFTHSCNGTTRNKSHMPSCKRLLGNQSHKSHINQSGLL